MATLPQYRSPQEQSRPGILSQRETARGQRDVYKSTQAEVIIHSLFLAGVLTAGMGAVFFVLLRATFWEIAASSAAVFVLVSPYCLRRAKSKRPGEFL